MYSNCGEMGNLDVSNKRLTIGLPITLLILICILHMHGEKMTLGPVKLTITDFPLEVQINVTTSVPKMRQTIPIQLKKSIIIVTFMRSGSTFLGELFNVHDDAFYMFEPLHLWPDTKCHADKFLEEKVKHLMKISKCEFENMYDQSLTWDEMQLAHNLTKGEVNDLHGTKIMINHEKITSSGKYSIIWFIIILVIFAS